MGWSRATMVCMGWSLATMQFLLSGDLSMQTVRQQLHKCTEGNSEHNNMHAKKIKTNDSSAKPQTVFCSDTWNFKGSLIK